MYPPQRARVRLASPRSDSSPYYDSSRAHMHEDICAHGYRCVASMCTRNAVPVGKGGGGHGVGWAGRPACWSAWCTCCAHCGAPAGGLQLTTPGGRGAEIPHVRGAERAALRLSLAGGRWRAVPRVRTTVVHRSPHHSLFTVRVQSTDVGTCMLGCCASSDELRECPLSALYTYRDTTIDVWTYGKIGISSGPATPGLVVVR